jgi:hypothetical protein
MFKNYQLEKSLKPYILIQDVVTRWNSTKAMITFFLISKYFFFIYLFYILFYFYLAFYYQVYGVYFSFSFF